MHLIFTICIRKRYVYLCIDITMACFQSLLTFLFTNLGNSQSYNTRNTITFRVEIHTMKSVISAEPKFWNSLPKEIKKNAKVPNISKQEYVTTCRIMHNIFLFLYTVFSVNTYRLIVKHDLSISFCIFIIITYTKCEYILLTCYIVFHNIIT